MRYSVAASKSPLAMCTQGGWVTCIAELQLLTVSLAEMIDRAKMMVVNF